MLIIEQDLSYSNLRRVRFVVLSIIRLKQWCSFDAVTGHVVQCTQNIQRWHMDGKSATFAETSAQLAEFKRRTLGRWICGARKPVLVGVQQPCRDGSNEMGVVPLIFLSLQNTV